jgi:hypothetical protein
MRHLVTFPKDGATVVGYGCSDCYWRYRPVNPHEVYTGAAFWNAQVLFEAHDCTKFKDPRHEDYVKSA